MMTLQQFFKEHPKTAVAFSGGTDSACLLYLARLYARETAAIYMKTQFQPAFEREDALCFCEKYGIPITVIEYDILQDERVAANPVTRCYFCKKALFERIRETADTLGLPDVADGTNADDDADDRPGMRALSELGILSPLRLCGLTKEQVRETSRQAGLFTADKPSYACLATRIPTGMRITADALARVEEAETSLAGMGFSDFRVRITEGGARLEIRKEQTPLLEEKREAVRNCLQLLFGEFRIFPNRGSPCRSQTPAR